MTVPWNVCKVCGCDFQSYPRHDRGIQPTCSTACGHKLRSIRARIEWLRAFSMYSAGRRITEIAHACGVQTVTVAGWLRRAGYIDYVPLRMGDRLHVKMEGRFTTWRSPAFYKGTPWEIQA